MVIFAPRAKDRPHRLAVCVVTLLGVDGLTLTVRALDAVDATPVLDVKPRTGEPTPRAPVRQVGG